MTQSSNPATPPSEASKLGNRAAEAMANPRETITDWGKKVGDFLTNLKAGNVIGGVLGAVGAWLIASMFGAGPFQTILAALLVPTGFILGAKTASEWSSGIQPRRAKHHPNSGVNFASPQLYQQPARLISYLEDAGNQPATYASADISPAAHLRASPTPYVEEGPPGRTLA